MEKISFGSSFILNALNNKKNIPITIQGKCMEPIINDGEKVFVTKIEDYQIGQIILFKDKKGKLLAHRIIEVDHRNLLLVTAGDNNHIADEPIKMSEVIGVIRINRVDEKIKNYEQKKITTYISTKLSKYIETSEYPDINIELTNSISDILEENKKRGICTIALHKGARLHLSDVRSKLLKNDNFSIFIGYEIGEKTIESNNIIGIDDVHYIFRLNNLCWKANTLRTDLCFISMLFR